MSKGKLILTPFPFTNLSGSKVRPALVLHAHAHSDDCIVAFVSAQEQKLGLYDIKISPSKANGIKTASVIKLNKIATLQKKVILGELGTLEKENMKSVDETLRKVFQI